MHNSSYKAILPDCVWLFNEVTLQSFTSPDMTATLSLSLTHTHTHTHTHKTVTM